jgi:hypothetical protein
MESYKIRLVSLNEKCEMHFEKLSNEFDRLDWISEISDCHNISREIVDLAINNKDNKSMFDDCHLFFSKFKSWYDNYFKYNLVHEYIKEQGFSNNSLWKGTVETDDNCNITGFDSTLYSLKMIYSEFSILEDAFQTKDTKDLLQNIDINYALHYYILQLVKYSLAPPIKRSDFYKESKKAYIELIELLCNLHSAELEAKYKDLIEPSLFPVLNKYCYSEGMGDYVFDLNVLKYIGISTFCDIAKLKKEIKNHRKKVEIEEAAKNENKKEDENESPDKSLMEAFSNNELPKNSQIAERAEIDNFLEGLKKEIWEGEDELWDIAFDSSLKDYFNYPIRFRGAKEIRMPINIPRIDYYLKELNSRLNKLEIEDEKLKNLIELPKKPMKRKEIYKKLLKVIYDFDISDDNLSMGKNDISKSENRGPDWIISKASDCVKKIKKYRGQKLVEIISK